MNLLLVDAGELAGDARDTCALADRRAHHLRTVVGAKPGSTVRAGIVGGGLGTAHVVDDDGTRMTLRFAITEPPSQPMPVELVLAVPRPKVLTRTIEAAATFAVERIALTNAWRVDKSYLRSPRVEAGALALAARLGAEQGATTHLPPIAMYERLMQLLDERWPEGHRDTRALLLAHPHAAPIETVYRGGPAVLAIGPEGGWIQREVDTFVARGFRAVGISTAILRVETAVAAALGQLALLARLSG